LIEEINQLSNMCLSYLLSEVLIMVRVWCLATTVFLMPLSQAWADQPGDRDDNAALKYWQAIASLPKLKDADVQRINDQYLTIPLDAGVKEIVGKANYSLKLMKQGTALKRCDWGVPYEDGLSVLLPYLDGVRMLTSMACLRARLELEAGLKAAAIEDLAATLALARHISQGGLLIETVFGYSLEHRSSEALAVLLPKFDADLIKDLKARLSALPPPGNPAKAMPTEELSSLGWFVKEVKKTKSKEDLVALVEPLFVVENEGKKRAFAEKARAFVEECGGDKEGMLKFAEEAHPSYAVMAKKLDLPLDEFQKAFEEETKKQEKNPVFKVFFPAMAKVRQAKARADVRRALLMAALDVQLSGQDALKKHTDPVAGGPFEYIPFGGSFELRSKYKGQNDKPLMLTVGSHSK
jgi:hypothetical protein